MPGVKRRKAKDNAYKDMFYNGPPSGIPKDTFYGQLSDAEIAKMQSLNINLDESFNSANIKGSPSTYGKKYNQGQTGQINESDIGVVGSSTHTSSSANVNLNEGHHKPGGIRRKQRQHRRYKQNINKPIINDVEKTVINDGKGGIGKAGKQMLKDATEFVGKHTKGLPGKAWNMVKRNKGNIIVGGIGATMLYGLYKTGSYLASNVPYNATNQERFNTR